MAIQDDHSQIFQKAQVSSDKMLHKKMNDQFFMPFHISFVASVGLQKPLNKGIWLTVSGIF